MEFAGVSILESTQFDREGILSILETADGFLPVAKKEQISDVMKGKVLATLFFEPSTRTRFSFETAMLRLGGKVISNYMMNETSSVKKSETLYDTAKMASTFADVIAMRHPQAGAVAEFAGGSSVPVINGGDGPHDHPTQGLLDVFTIWKHFGKLGGLTYGMVGDMKYSRVVHSQCEYLKHFEKSKFVFISPEALKLPADLIETLKSHGHEVVETDDLETVLSDLDVLSNTRIQQERFDSVEESEKYLGLYSISSELMKNAKEDMIVIDPLPRISDQILQEFDNDPRAKYFEQVVNGVAVRMALLVKVLNMNK